MPKIYTRTGDAGETGLIGGRRVLKDDPRVEAYGVLDEANSALGLLAAHLGDDLAALIRGIQSALFDIGAEVANPGPDPQPSIAAGDVEGLERLIDAWEAELPGLRTFILPGGSHASALCHVARAAVRRAERRAVRLSRAAPLNPEILRYLNRLSDALFVLARLANRRAKVADIPWKGQTR